MHLHSLGSLGTCSLPAAIAWLVTRAMSRSWSCQPRASQAPRSASGLPGGAERRARRARRRSIVQRGACSTLDSKVRVNPAEGLKDGNIPTIPTLTGLLSCF